MFSSIPAFRADLAARLTDGVPTTWRVVPGLTAASEQQRPAVYIEFTQIDTQTSRGNLPRGQVLATVDVVVVDPRTGDTAETAVDDELPAVLAVLDQHDDIGWTTARKERQDAGPLQWRITAAALVNITPPAPAPADADTLEEISE